jgi:hypothetical protein
MRRRIIWQNFTGVSEEYFGRLILYIVAFNNANLYMRIRHGAAEVARAAV